MDDHYMCTSVKEFNEMVRRIKPLLYTEIHKIYNLGGEQYYEYPLIIVAGEHTFRFYYSYGELIVDVYKTTEFRSQITGGIFRSREDPGAFDYVYSEFAYSPEASVCGLIPVKGIGTANNLRGFDVRLSGGRKICVRESELVEGTMDSWIEGI